MQSPPMRTVRVACKRYGPGRLPHADRHDIGAGYAAATAALVATVLYATSTSVGAVLFTDGNWIANMVFPLLAIPFVVPAAFLVGVAGWRLLPSYSTTTGIIAGVLGVIATYLVTLILVGTLLTATAALSLSGAEPDAAALFSVGLLSVAFYLTWWITVPVGCLSGLVYVNAVDAPR